MARSRGTGRRWSQHVTLTSHALDLEPRVFNGRSAWAVARSLKRSADESTQRKTSAFRSAMSMLTFCMNRAGRALPDSRRRVLERAKHALRRLYGRPDPGESDRRHSRKTE